MAASASSSSRTRTQAFFDRGAYYGFQDDPERFAFFSKAALEFLLVSGKRPDVIHTHDWQTALVPVLLYEMYAGAGLANQRVCHTIHNFRHQGVTHAGILQATGLGRPEYFGAPDRMGDDLDHHAINLTRGAILYSNFVTTVSPHHAWEVRHTDLGYGLGNVLHKYQDKFGGILNGLDYEMWNPETDPHVASHFSAAHPAGKRGNTAALRSRMLLRDTARPILAYVGRLDTQKGLHLIRHAIFYALHHDAQFVLLGSGAEQGINEDFWHLKRRLNDHPDCHLEIGYDEELAHLIYAGADLLVMPSLYEPCGLSQMIALRYGTVPVVRNVGGLRDSVFDWDFSERPRAERNGFVFEHADNAGLESALSRAFGLWHNEPPAVPATGGPGHGVRLLVESPRRALRRHLRVHPSQIGTHADAIGRDQGRASEPERRRGADRRGNRCRARIARVPGRKPDPVRPDPQRQRHRAAHAPAADSCRR